MALNSLELAASLGATAPAPTGGATGPAIEAETVRAAVQRRALYDRNGDFHYDLISALESEECVGCWMKHDETIRRNDRSQRSDWFMCPLLEWWIGLVLQPTISLHMNERL